MPDSAQPVAPERNSAVLPAPPNPYVINFDLLDGMPGVGNVFSLPNEIGGLVVYRTVSDGGTVSYESQGQHCYIGKRDVVRVVAASTEGYLLQTAGDVIPGSQQCLRGMQVPVERGVMYRMVNGDAMNKQRAARERDRQHAARQIQFARQIEGGGIDTSDRLGEPNTP